MKTTLIQVAVWTVLGTIASAQAQAQTASVPQVQPAPKPQVRYDFAYTVADNRIQVFDDGSVTRIALPDGTLAPTVIAVRPGGEVLLVPRRDPPNLVFDGIHARLVLRWANGREVVATYKGSNHMSARNGTPAAFGAVLPAASYGVQPAPVVYSAAPTPVGTEPPAKVAGIVDGEAVVIPVAVPAAVSPIAAPPVADTQVTATTLSATAAPLPAARPIAAIKALATTKQYEVRLSDMRLSTAFARWAMDDGVRIRWEADKHLLIDAPMAFEAKDAAQAVAMALATPGISSGAYPLEVCEYPNTPPLLRVTRRGEQTKECPFLNN